MSRIRLEYRLTDGTQSMTGDILRTTVEAASIPASIEMLRNIHQATEGQTTGIRVLRAVICEDVEASPKGLKEKLIKICFALLTLPMVLSMLSGGERSQPGGCCSPFLV